MFPPSAKYVNRELSWLEFNQRVLDEAKNHSVPLLERLKFLAITSSNLDEFFMVRVGGLQTLRRTGSAKQDPAGMTATQQLAAISRRVRQMVAEQHRCLQESLQPKLADAGIRCLQPTQLTPQQLTAVRSFFDAEVFGVFTPMAIDPAREFPLLPNQTLNLCVRLEPPNGSTEPRFAVIPLGHIHNRFVRLPADGGGYEYMLLEELISMHASLLFNGEKIIECVPFRISRNAELSVREDMAADLLSFMEVVLDARKQSDCVRLEISDRAGREVTDFLQRSLTIDSDFTYPINGPLDLASFMGLATIPGFDTLKYEPRTPHPSADIDHRASMFEVIREKDVLLSLPYESVDPLVRLLDEAADDPGVLSIKISLYRTSRQSPIVEALARAAANEKHVTALVELKARFDEARNIGWAKLLEQSGVQVIYGVKGLKTHAKVCVITRQEPQGIQRYVHFATGNYNEVTATLYSDVGYFTCNPDLALDAANVFHAICGYSQPQRLRKLAVAPIGLRERLLDLIEGEVERKKRGQPAHIMLQVNSLADCQLIDALYAASAAGVTIDLNVRGICCLRPGVRGLSANISAVSILDRFLEHSRIFYFHRGGDPMVFISSADWMPRNLDRRVELLIPVDEPHCREQLIAILRSYQQDNVKARKLLSSGGFLRPSPPADLQQRHQHQEFLYRLADTPPSNPKQSSPPAIAPDRPLDQQKSTAHLTTESTLANDL